MVSYVAMDEDVDGFVNAAVNDFVLFEKVDKLSENVDSLSEKLDNFRWTDSMFRLITLHFVLFSVIVTMELLDWDVSAISAISAISIMLSVSLALALFL